ncbi:hypothetical protein GBAR_LOCUS15797 [Geodia barretti]|nr:hypothetical protein GBAR_LOCUS15797 [Geodia barretti]
MYGEIVYNSLVAEIQPEGRVFDLNLESSEFRRLQFVHMEPSQRPRHGRQQQQLQSCLLVVCPNNFAAIYTFKIQCIRTGYVVLHEPDKEVLCSEFHWYQWDPSTQWLYLAQFESSGTRMQSLLSGDNSIVLHCYSFAQHKHDLSANCGTATPLHCRTLPEGRNILPLTTSSCPPGSRDQHAGSLPPKRPLVCMPAAWQWGCISGDCCH